jgi:PTS system N-acetylglucosamine-specific IIC component
VLYALHAVLTGLAMVIMNALHVRLGFSFSAGLFDYVINFGKATNPLLLIPVGLGYFALYYGVFRFAIVRFDLKTPGREPEGEVALAVVSADQPRARGFIEALGGAANLASVDACTTRLRLVLADQAKVNEPALKGLGARGFVRPSPRHLQVVLGPIADEVAREIRETLGAPQPAPAAAEAPAALGAAAPIDRELGAALLAALGGAGNVRGVECAANRLLLALNDTAKIERDALRRLGVRAIAQPAADSAHLILGEDAAGLADALVSAKG